MNLNYAQHDQRTVEFMKDLAMLFAKHNLAVLPTYGDSVSIHDDLRVVKMSDAVAVFYANTGVSVGKIETI